MIKSHNVLIFFASLATMVPSLSGWYAVFITGLALLAVYIARSFGVRYVWTTVFLSIIFLVLGLSGILSCELITSVYACGLLAFYFPKFTPIAIFLLFIETPLFQTVALIAGSNLSPQFEQAAPAITYLLIASFIFNRSTVKMIASSIFIILVTLLGWYLNTDVLIVGCINALILGIFLANIKVEKILYPSFKFVSLIFIVAAHSLLISGALSTIENIVVWIPPEKDKYEYQFFKDYEETLKLAGIAVKGVNDASGIEKNSLVLVPWGTEFETYKFLIDLKKLPIANTLTVLIGGEHTNYNGFSDRLNPIFNGSVSFKNTTTIPPTNANEMGALWTSSILQFPFGATLNRGSSLGIFNLNVFPILIAKSIFSDLGPKDYNDFWVGDFQLGQFDSRGWTLIMAAYKDGPLWILSGDNSFLMNRYLLPNPEPIFSVISLSTLRPLLLMELWILITMIIWGVSFRLNLTSTVNQRLLFFTPAIVLIPMIIYLGYQTLPFRGSTILDLKYFGGDERSSAVTIAANSGAINAGIRKLYIHENGFSAKDVGNSGRAEIHIGHVKNQFEFGGVKIDNCGFTNYSTQNTPKITLLEAQFCRVTGDAKVIVGNNDQASILEINSSPPIILILDKYFLAGSPPVDLNVDYILQLLIKPTSE
jgi:hypothetical protein